MKKGYGLMLVSIICAPLLYWLSRYNYILFHTTIELFTVVVGILIFTIAIISQEYSRDTLTERFGYGMLVVSVLVFLHTISYKGMNIIEGYNANLPTQFWIALNYIQSISLLLAIYLRNKKVNKWIFLTFYSLIGAIFIYLCFTRIFPNCYLEGAGLTPFKKISEYIIICIYIICFIGLHIKKLSEAKKLLLFAVLLFILAEFAFTLYSDVYGIQNFLGHYLRLIGLFLVFSSIVITGIKEPYETIFIELKNLSERDGLTDLYNRNYLKKHLSEFKVNNKFSSYIVFFDIDDFKSINDRFGHETGDEVLIKVADVVKRNIRKSDKAIRFGGDEFLIVFTEVSFDQAKKSWERINSEIETCMMKDKEINLTVSAGLSKIDIDFKNTFKQIDILLHKVKRNGKHKTLYS